MPAHASCSWSTLAGIVLVAGVLDANGACKRQSYLPPLPQPPQISAPEPRHSPKSVAYRAEPGTPIAPSVIPDEPPPTALAAPSASSDKAAVQRATLNGDPNGITRETLNRSVQGAMGALAGCFASMTQDPTVAVSFEADPSGKPSLVRISGAPPDSEHCVRQVVQGIRFPAFDGKAVQVDLPLSFHRVASPTQVNQPAQAPTGPSLFLQP
jgi:hypothetical protein